MKDILINYLVPYGGILFHSPDTFVGFNAGTGKPGACKASWGGVYCFEPLSYAVTLKGQAEACKSIAYRGAFTVNILMEKYAGVKGYTKPYTCDGLFTSDSVGVTLSQSKNVDAPYIKEALITVECRLEEILKANDYEEFIGEIVLIRSPEQSESSGRQYTCGMQSVILAMKLFDLMRQSKK